MIYDAKQFLAPFLRKVVLGLYNVYYPFLIVSHDSLNSSWSYYQEIIAKSGLTVLASLSGRIAYIGYFDGKTIKEFSHPKTINFQIPIGSFWEKWLLPSPLFNRSPSLTMGVPEGTEK